MTVFSERLVEDIRLRPGGQLSFLSQVCSPRGQRYREALEELASAAGEHLRCRARPLLTSLDNRRFFQGYAELATAALLARGPLDVDAVSPHGLMRAAGEAGEFNVSVLSFIHKSTPAPDGQTTRRLVSALNRVGSQERLMVVVHCWLPQDFEPDVVRRAVDNWLTDVDKGYWQGRYASFVDEEKGIHLEFGLTGRKTRVGPRVVATMGPFLSRLSMAAVESRVLADADRYRLGSRSGDPLIVACVADQPWAISRAYLTDFLYGRARSTEMYRDGELHGAEMTFDAGQAPSLFRDPLYKAISALLWLARDPSDPRRLLARAFLNPWARRPVTAAAFPGIPAMSLVRWDDGRAVVRLDPGDGEAQGLLPDSPNGSSDPLTRR